MAIKKYVSLNTLSVFFRLPKKYIYNQRVC